MVKKTKPSYYSVHKGRVPGVYTDWPSCQAQVDKFPNARFKGFDTRDEAAFFVETGKFPADGDYGAKLLFVEWKRKQRQQAPPPPLLPSPSPPPPVQQHPWVQPLHPNSHSLLRGGISSVNAVVSNVKVEPSSSSSSFSSSARLVKQEDLDGSQSYFSQVPNFKPNEGADFENEFRRFASSQNIQPGSQAWKRHRTTAISHEIMFHYSQRPKSESSDDESSSDDDDDNDEDKDKNNLGIKREDTDIRDYRQPARRGGEASTLLVYQNMCREAGLAARTTIEGCVVALKSVLVNIVDYIDAKRNGSRITVWPPHKFEAFKKYTLDDPSHCINFQAARGTVLEALLQNLRRADAAAMYEQQRRRAGWHGVDDIVVKEEPPSTATGRRSSSSARSGGDSSGSSSSSGFGFALGRRARLEQQRRLRQEAEQQLNQEQRERERGLSVVKEEEESDSESEDEEKEAEVKPEPYPTQTQTQTQTQPRGRFGTWGDCSEVISIHDSELGYAWPSSSQVQQLPSSSPRTPGLHLNGNNNKSSPVSVLLPLSPNEIPSSGQVGLKRYFKEEDDDDDDDEENFAPIATNNRRRRSSNNTAKRPRVWKDEDSIKPSGLGLELASAPVVIVLSP